MKTNGVYVPCCATNNADTYRAPEMIQTNVTLTYSSVSTLGGRESGGRDCNVSEIRVGTKMGLLHCLLRVTVRRILLREREVIDGILTIAWEILGVQ